MIFRIESQHVDSTSPTALFSVFCEVLIRGPLRRHIVTKHVTFAKKLSIQTFRRGLSKPSRLNSQ